MDTLPNVETGMDLRDLLDDVSFLGREKPPRSPARVSRALRTIAQVFAETPEVVLQKLVDVAVEFCGADSAGISLEEADEAGAPTFRWVAIAGSFTQYLNGRTPRFFSPCGTCLNTGRPQLYRVTKPYYDYLGVVAEPITDGMLIPWQSEDVRGTVWAVSHCSDEAFDLEDYRLLRSVADFALIAIRHQHNERALRRLESQKAADTMANRLAHRINNPLQCLTNSLYLASQGRENTQEHVQQAIADLQTLTDLVAKLLDLQAINKGAING
jgi:GAF domain